jgi:hypothetical protein
LSNAPTIRRLSRASPIRSRSPIRDCALQDPRTCMHNRDPLERHKAMLGTCQALAAPRHSPVSTQRGHAFIVSSRRSMAVRSVPRPARRSNLELDRARRENVKHSLVILWRCARSRCRR